MNELARNALPAAMLYGFFGGLCCGAAMATGLSMAEQWTNKNPFAKIANDKSLRD